MSEIVKDVIEEETMDTSTRLLTIIGETGIIYDGAMWR